MSTAWPMRRGLNLAEVMVPKFCGQFMSVKYYEPELGSAEPPPRHEILSFYLTQHVMSLASSAPVSVQCSLEDVYKRVLRRGTARIAHYLLLICARESRHMTTSIRSLLADKFSKSLLDFTDNLPDLPEVAVNQFQKLPPAVSLSEYSNFLVTAFETGHWQGKYGGKPWARVAKPFRAFVHGEMSPEVLLDTAFALQHHNGPIFNKGMLYSYEYTAEQIHQLLGLQHQGQIPNVVYRASPTGYVLPWHKDFLAESLTVLSHETLGLDKVLPELQ